MGHLESSRPAIVVEDVAHRLACNSKPRPDRNLDAISAVPLDRWDTESTKEAIGARFGGFVSSWAEFDAGVFGISPSEAAFLDPAQRVLLQVSTSSLDNALRDLSRPQCQYNLCLPYECDAL